MVNVGPDLIRTKMRKRLKRFHRRRSPEFHHYLSSYNQALAFLLQVQYDQNCASQCSRYTGRIASIKSFCGRIHIDRGHAILKQNCERRDYKKLCT